MFLPLNTMLNINPSALPELNPHHIDNREVSVSERDSLTGAWKQCGNDGLVSTFDDYVNVT